MSRSCWTSFPEHPRGSSQTRQKTGIIQQNKRLRVKGRMMNRGKLAVALMLTAAGAGVAVAQAPAP